MALGRSPTLKQAAADVQDGAALEILRLGEEPVAAARLTGFREMKKQGALPIILDEGVVKFEGGQPGKNGEFKTHLQEPQTRGLTA